MYGLFALCIAVLYRLTGVVHLAIGELAGIGVFTTLWIALGDDPIAGARTRIPLGVAIAAALVVSAVLGAAVYKLAVDPFVRHGFSIAWVGALVAAAIALRGLVQLVFPRASYTFSEVFPLDGLGDDGVFYLGGGATVQARVIVVGGVALLAVVGAGWFLQRSRAGRGLRAIAEDRTAAALVGVPVERLLVWSFALAAFGGAALAVVALSGSAVSVNSCTLLGLKGLVAAVASRFGSPPRVIVCALLLGLLETALASFHLGPLELGPAYRDVIPLALAILLLSIWGVRTPLQERT